MVKRFWFILLILLVLDVNASKKDRYYIREPNMSLSQKEAILILPGFGSKVQGTKDIADFFFFRDYDVYIPDYISRKSIADCVGNLDDFMNHHRLNEYRYIHVFSYIVGSWTINEWIRKYPKNNIRSIVYDRSPLQERAPYALVKDMRVLIRILSGKIMKEFSQTPYKGIPNDEKQIGIIIENKATKLIRKHRKSAMIPGPIQWQSDSLRQLSDDHIYYFIDHDEMYYRFDLIGAEVLRFFSNGKFSDTLSRKQLAIDPFTPRPNSK